MNMKWSEADGEGLGEKRKKCARVKKERFQEQLMSSLCGEVSDTVMKLVASRF